MAHWSKRLSCGVAVVGWPAWRVEVISWANCCNQRMRRWVEENGVFIPLDDYYEAVTFLAPTSADYPTADPRYAAPLDLSIRPRAAS